MTYPPLWSRCTAASRGTRTTPSRSCGYRLVPCPTASHTGKTARNAIRSDTEVSPSAQIRDRHERGSAVGNVADDTHCERRIHGQNLFGVDADLALAGDDRPVDLIVILPGFELGDVRHFVRLVLNRQVLGPADDRAGRHPRVDLDRDSKTAIYRERIIVELHHAGRRHLVLTLAPVCRGVEAQQRP